MRASLRDVKEGSTFNGYALIEETDVVSSTVFRKTFECEIQGEEGILIIYDKNLTPPDVLVEDDDGHDVPYEYFVLKSKQEYFLPKLIADGADSDFMWLFFEKKEGMTLAEYIALNVDNTNTLRYKEYVSMCSWIMVSLSYMWKSAPHLRLLVTPDNLYVTYDEEDCPILTICNLHSALSLEYGLLAPYIGADSRYIAPEFLQKVYSQYSFVYNAALLLLFSLNGLLPDDDILNGHLYDDIAMVQMRAEYNVNKLKSISDIRKQVLMCALNLDPEKRPTIDAFIEMWDSEKVISYGANSDVFGMNMMEDIFGAAGNGINGKFDGMFTKSSGKGFSEVGGMSDLKKVLEEKYINPIKYPEIAKIYNMTPPHGILLYGPPGCGKSFIAQKLCEELECFYIKVKASDLGGSLHREGVLNIGALFEAAERKAKESNLPVMIIMDECDGLLQHRNQELSPGAAAETNMFLTMLENCAERGVHVICTTNDPSGVDSAALRSGRIGEQYFVPLPDNETKKDIMILNLNPLPHKDMNLPALIEMTDRFTSSDVAQAVELAASKALSMMIENLPSKDVVEIDHAMMSSIISNMTSSLTSEDIVKHDKIHKRYTSGKKETKQRIGFNI